LTVDIYVSPYIRLCLLHKVKGNQFDKE
jgi:hypothetical protein